MATTHVLYLTNESLVSLVARGGKITQRKVFPVSGPGAADFEAHITGLRHAPTHIITDLSEEDFRLDTIPHLGARDREAVVSRKLTQLFRSTVYRHAFAQGREPDGRRDDRVIYTAITNEQLLRPWVEIFERLHVPVEGIYSSAVLSGRLLADLGLASPHTLLVTFTPGDAVRQAFFRDKEIKFSRLTPIDLEEGVTLGGFLAGETARTWQYLDSLRYFGAGEQLEVCMLVHAKDRPAIQPALRDVDQIRYRLVDIEQAAGKLGMKPPPVSSSAEEIIAHAFLRRSEANHFAPPELRRFAVIRRARIAIRIAAAGVLAAGLAYGGWNLALALQHRDKGLQNLDQVAMFDRQHDELLRTIPSRGAAGQTMRDAVAFYSGSMRAYPTVASFLLPLSAVLERYPNIRLSQIQWRTADDEKLTPALVPIAPRTLPPLKAAVGGKDASAEASARAAVPAEGPFATGRYAVAMVEGTVKIEGLGFRDALAQVEKLVGDIGRLKGYTASIVDSPLDVSPTRGIQGKFDAFSPGTSDARFSLRVTRTTEIKP
jgi:hypothetical protein